MNQYIRQSVRAMSGYIPGEQPHGKCAASVIKLNTNENPYPPSPRVKKALLNFCAEDLRLYPDPENRRVRRKIAEIHSCNIEQVFVGNGSDEILALCSRAFVENDGSIGFFVPSYSLYHVLTSIRDVTAQPVNLGPDFQWHMPDNYHASLFFLTNPNAPTGILYPKKTVRSFCECFDGIVVIDEAYVDFSSRHCIELALELDNVLVARTMSKSYSLAGIRMGYAIGPCQLIKALFKIKDSYNLSRITQEVAIAALSDQQTMHANADRIKHTRRRLASELEQCGFVIYPSETNFLWVMPPKITTETFYQRLRERNILVRYFPGNLTDSFLRITVGTDEQTDALLEAVRLILNANGA